MQAYIEEPEVHILALCSSTIEEQTALISDQIECIKEMSTALKSPNNISITDRLLFFSGDKPAAQFERGTQMGGNYPCGTHIACFDDFARCAHNKWRSLQMIQTLATKGILQQLVHALNTVSHSYIYNKQAHTLLCHMHTHTHINTNNGSFQQPSQKA